MLSGQGVDCGDAGDVDDGDLGAGFDDALEERLHDGLGAGAVEGADDGEGEDAVPELDDGCGELEHLLLLAEDDGLAGLLVSFHNEQAEGVEEVGGRGDEGDLGAGVGFGGADLVEEGLLEGKDELGRLGRGKAELSAGGGEGLEELAEVAEGRGGGVRFFLEGRLGGGLLEELEELAGVAAEVVFLDAAAEVADLGLVVDPGGEEVGFVGAEDGGKAGGCQGWDLDLAGLDGCATRVIRRMRLCRVPGLEPS